MFDKGERLIRHILHFGTGFERQDTRKNSKGKSDFYKQVLD